MISYAEALRLTLSAVPEPSAESCRLQECAGKVLAEEIRADHDVPPFTRALMDGFALRSQDLARGWRRLRVIGEVAAGGPPPPRPIGPGECLRIMTGAPLPDGADAVQIREETESLSEVEVVIHGTVAPGANLLPAGSEIPRGTVVLKTGQKLGSPQLALLATLGKDHILTWQPPSLKVISTGDELVSPGQPLSGAQVYDSNGLMLAARAKELGIPVCRWEHVGDDPSAMRRLLEGGEEDLLIWTGGVSAGDRDYVHRMVAEAGFEIVFHKVRIKPGKPVLLARQGRRLVFGLPGNPVSAAVTFELFVRTAVRRWMGFRACTLPETKARLVEPLQQRPGRLFFRPGILRAGKEEGWQVRPTGWVSSADLQAYAAANCLIQVPAEAADLAAGAIVRVSVLDAAAGAGELLWQPADEGGESPGQE
jgi:molybdopterin molybdotransferase